MTYKASDRLREWAHKCPDVRIEKHISDLLAHWKKYPPDYIDKLQQDIDERNVEISGLESDRNEWKKEVVVLREKAIQTEVEIVRLKDIIESTGMTETAVAVHNQRKREEQAYVKDLESQIDNQAGCVKAVRDMLAEAYTYAKNLFAHLAPECAPRSTIVGVLSQINNWCVGSREERKRAAEEVKRLKTVIDGLKLRGLGQEDAVRSLLNYREKAIATSVDVLDLLDRLEKERGGRA